MAYLSQAFAIASFAFSIIAIFVPVFGVFMAGLSGILAWGSYGRFVALGFAAVIINIVNILLLSPAFLALVALEYSERTPDQNMTLRIWIIILAIQAIALFLLVSNLIIFRFLKGRNRIKDPAAKQTLPPPGQSAQPFNSQSPDGSTDAVNDRTGNINERIYQNQKGVEHGENISAEAYTETIKIDKIVRSSNKQLSMAPILVSVFLFGAIIWGVSNFVLSDKPYVPLNRVYEELQDSSTILAKNRETELSTQESVHSRVDKDPPVDKPVDEIRIVPNTTITQEMLDEAWGGLKPDTQKAEPASQPTEPKRTIVPEVESRSKPSQAADKLYYYYAIKLKTGERIITRNAIIHKDAVDYIDSNGVMTSVNRNLIESLKKFYYKHKN